MMVQYLLLSPRVHQKLLAAALMGLVNGVNKMAKLVKVKSHLKKLGKRRFKVKGYFRHNKPLGKKIKYKEVGRFKIALDEYGNIRGSKIVTPKISSVAPKKETKIKVQKKKRIVNKKFKRKVRYTDPDTLDANFWKGNIDYNDWITERRKLMSK